MKSTGFTLIELLAVIVILAIIALIATPIILGIIKDSEKKSKEISIKNYASAIEQAIVRRNMKEEFKPSKCEITDRKVFCDDSEIPLEVQVDGETPKEGTIMIENGTVVKVVEKAENKYVIYENGEILHNGEITEPVSFKEDSWETISLNVKVGNIEVYKKNFEENVNNTKTVDTKTFGTHTVRIANVSTPDECSTIGFSQTACGFVVEFEDIITTYNMNPKGEYKGVQYDFGWNVDGYPASSLYKFINEEKEDTITSIYESLPEELKEVIINTKVVSSHGSTTGETNFISTDKLYLLSGKEVWGSIPAGDDTSVDQTRQLDYYKNYKNMDGSIGVTISSHSGAIKKYNENAFSWWIRSASSNSTRNFFHVNNMGDYKIMDAFGRIGVAVAFRIG